MQSETCSLLFYTYHTCAFRLQLLYSTLHRLVARHRIRDRLKLWTSHAGGLSAQPYTIRTAFSENEPLRSTHDRRSRLPRLLVRHSFGSEQFIDRRRRSFVCRFGQRLGHIDSTCTGHEHDQRGERD
jgi:hypothetical protein